MKCPTTCPGELRVTHTYTEGTVQTRRSVCQECRIVFTAITIFCPADEVGGAAAVVTAIREGQDPAKLIGR